VNERKRKNRAPRHLPTPPAQSGLRSAPPCPGRIVGSRSRRWRCCATGARDAALLAVLYGSGVRRAEVVQLDVTGFHPESGEVRVRSGRGHQGPADPGAGTRLVGSGGVDRCTGKRVGPAFVPIHRSGGLQTRRMGEQSIYDILKRRAEEAGIPLFRRRTRGAPSPAICWTRARTTAPCSSSSGTRAWPPRRGM